MNGIGIFGGTFNPVHNGHLAMAEAALRECKLSKIVFMPNGNPPHKSGNVDVSPFHRANMVELAIGANKNYEISRYEINRTEPSYTVDTNRVMKKKYNCPVHFIIGADSLYTLNKWWCYEELVSECSFIVAARKCNQGSNIYAACEAHRKKGGKVILLDMPEVDITSTDIRLMIKNGEDISALVPDEVQKYMLAHGLYV